MDVSLTLLTFTEKLIKSMSIQTSTFYFLNDFPFSFSFNTPIGNNNYSLFAFLQP